jgi:transposase
MARTPPREIRGPGGALHLRSEDEAARDLAMLIDGETSGRPRDEVLRTYGRSRSTYYEKLRRFRNQGLEGLLTRPPGPLRPWRRPLEVIRYIVTRRIRSPELPAATIAADLERLGHGVSVRSVERTLTQFGLTRGSPRSSVAPDGTSTQGTS